MVQGSSQAISPEEFNAIAKEGTGRSTEVIALPGGDLGRTVLTKTSRLPKQVLLSNKLTSQQTPLVYGHEIGHVIDQLAGEIPTKGLLKELEGVYNTLNNPNRAGAEAAAWGRSYKPQHAGYGPNDVPRELMAEALRAYHSNPNFLKTEAPKTAAAIRAAVNADPNVNKIIQFNSALVALGLAGKDEVSNGNH